MFHEFNTHSLKRGEFNIKSTGPGAWRPHFSPTSVISLKCEFGHGTSLIFLIYKGKRGFYMISVALFSNSDSLLL